jgi:hypothetical protein
LSAACRERTTAAYAAVVFFDSLTTSIDARCERKRDRQNLHGSSSSPCRTTRFVAFSSGQEQRSQIIFWPVIDVAVNFRWRSVHVRNAQKAGCEVCLSQ